MRYQYQPMNVKWVRNWPITGCEIYFSLISDFSHFFSSHLVSIWHLGTKVLLWQFLPFLLHIKFLVFTTNCVYCIDTSDFVDRTLSDFLKNTMCGKLFLIYFEIQCPQTLFEVDWVTGFSRMSILKDINRGQYVSNF